MIFSYDSITSFMDKILWILYDPVSPVETGSKSVDGSHESPYLLQWNQGTSPWNSHHIPMKFPWNSHMKFSKKFWCEGTTGSQSYWFKVRSLRYRAHRVGLAWRWMPKIRKILKDQDGIVRFVSLILDQPWLDTLVLESFAMINKS